MSSSTVAIAADTYEIYEELTSGLPTIHEPYFTQHCLYQGYWFMKHTVPAIMAAQDHFMARPTDLFLCSFPKTGTTWLKALMFCVVTRASYSDLADHPLRRANPHSCVSYLEDMYKKRGDQVLDLEEPCLSPRILANHMPYSVLPESIKSSTGCRLVYTCREPKDTLISYWKFEMKISGKKVDVEEFIEGHLRGEGPFGPMWDHMLSYWRESRKNPNKVMFLKYEEIKKDEEGVLKRLANFMGYPFSPKEEDDGVVRRIVELCTFENLSKLEVNASEKSVNAFGLTLVSNVYFRKGEVGDWTNYLTPEMAKRIDDIFKVKLQGSGLTFYDDSDS